MITKLIRADNIIDLESRMDHYLDHLKEQIGSRHELIFHHAEYFGNPDIATPLAVILILEIKRKQRITRPQSSYSIATIGALLAGMSMTPGDKKTWQQRMEEMKKQQSTKNEKS